MADSSEDVNPRNPATSLSYRKRTAEPSFESDPDRARSLKRLKSDQPGRRSHARNIDTPPSTITQKSVNALRQRRDIVHSQSNMSPSSFATLPQLKTPSDPVDPDLRVANDTKGTARRNLTESCTIQ